MTRIQALQMTHKCRITSLGEFTHGFVIYQNAAKEIINQIYDSLEEQIQGLQSLLDLKQQEISVLESKVVEHRRCFECKDKHYCYSFSTLTEDQSYFMCCPMFEPMSES